MSLIQGALTFIQPWATACLRFGKDIENRPWAPPRSFIGQRFAVHAGKKLDKGDAWDLKRALECELGDVPLGAILGTVELAGFVYISPAGHVSSHGLTPEQETAALASRWRAEGAPVLWVLRNPRELAEPIPYKGMLGLWGVPTQLAKRIEAQERRVAHA